jgi:WD domain, G-beta repeat
LNSLKWIGEKQRLWLAGPLLAFFFLGGFSVLPAGPPVSQVETVPATSQSFTWVNKGRIEGHLALNYSPAGAFSPDSSSLAVVNHDKIVMTNLEDGSVVKVLHPQIPNLRDLDIQSANFIAPSTIYLLGTGVLHEKGKAARQTPLLGFQWNTEQDAVVGKVEAFGAGGDVGRPRYFPHIGYLGMYKESAFILWNVTSQRAGEIKIPDLTRQPNLYTFSPDGHWLLLAQIAGSGSPDPVVVRLSEHKFVATLAGHQGTVLGMSFSRDSSEVLTACEDGKIRIWSAPAWRLIETLAGHQGPVRWAEFSPDGQWVASAGEDKTVRIWSVEGGKLVQTLRESEAPIATVSFSPNGSYIAASTEHSVLIWGKTSTGQ